MPKTIAVIGGSGAIGHAFTKRLATSYFDANIYVFSRSLPKEPLTHLNYHVINYNNESSIKEAALIASEKAPLDIVIVATGMLHDDTIKPEKNLRDLCAEKFLRLFSVNTILPALIIKYFLPRMNHEHRSVFAVLSARVGSISDNRLGGWYAYRASKAALNMIIKNASIEIGRTNKKVIVIGLHPGTVDSNLSKPFQGNVAQEKLFTPDFAVTRMQAVLDSLTPKDSGRCFAWDGQEVSP